MIASEPVILEEIDRGSPEFAEMLEIDGKTPEQFQGELMRSLHLWLGERRHLIARTLIRVEGSALSVMLATVQPGFDFDLAIEGTAFKNDLRDQHGWTVPRLLQWGNASFEDLRYASGCAAGENYEG